MKVKFNNQYYSKKNIELKKLNTLSYNGKFTLKIEKKLKKKINTKKVFLTKSATSALEACAYLINLQKNDEVIMASYNYYSTANAFALRGAKIIFADINLDDLNISYYEIFKKITKKTKAIILTHYAGKACDLKKIKFLANKYKLYLIEDASHAFGSKLENEHLGTFGDFGVYSFHETKNISCGDGGALIINKKKFIKKAEYFLSKGTNKMDLEKGLIKKYEWKSLGSNSKLSELNAILLYHQLIRERAITKIRKQNYEKYYEFFKLINNKNIFSFSKIKHFSKHNYHIFYIIFKKPKIKDKFIKYMSSKKIQCFFHYSSLANSNFFLNHNKFQSFPNSEYVSKRLVRLPLQISKKQQDYIFKNIKKFKDIFI